MGGPSALVLTLEAGACNRTGALVCTIEKANQLVGRMMEEQSLSELGALVVDELHMVADDDRCVRVCMPLFCALVLVCSSGCGSQGVPVHMAHMIWGCGRRAGTREESLANGQEGVPGLALLSTTPHCMCHPQGLPPGAAAHKAEVLHSNHGDLHRCGWWHCWVVGAMPCSCVALTAPVCVHFITIESSSAHTSSQHNPFSPLS